ncbi:MAG: GNAT family N-acetyltransferase [Acidimicrobiia bacterium]|nr:GNAT family N-acetyltransferase [Acidimicrobiia bacterium]
MNMHVSPATRPVGYPTELELQLTLADGRGVSVRPMVPDDASLLSLELERADADTIYQRFFRNPVRFDAATLEHMTHLDYRERLAVAAFTANDEGVAIARYETVEPGDAEVAIVVKPDWRRAGLGRALLDLLERAAIARGVTRFIAVYLPANERIVALLGSVGFAIDGMVGGLGQASKQLVDAPPRSDGGVL